ncbi:MAG: DUF4302 domain-containing protein [Prolixibacteraceae bacterium]
MFKKYITLLFLTSIFMAGCQKTEIEDVFSKDAETRTNERLASFDTKLKSEELWLGTMYTETEETTVFFKMKFEDNKRSKVGFASKDITEAIESSYSLNYTQQEDLVFDTHSLMASIVDYGIKGDFRWALIEETDDYLLFKSRAEENIGKSYLRLEKYNEELYTTKSKIVNDTDISLFRNLELEGSETRYGFSYNLALSKAYFKYWNEEEERVVTKIIDASVTATDIVLDEKIDIDGKAYSKFTYTDGEGFVSNENGQKATIRYSGYSPVPQTGANYVYGTTRTKLYFAVETADHKKHSNAYVQELINLMNKGINVSSILFFNSNKYGTYLRIKTDKGNVYINFTIENHELGRKVLVAKDPIPDIVKNLVAPLFSAEGIYFIEKGRYITGDGKRYTNNSVEIVSVSTPTFRVYAYAGGKP